MKLEELAEQNIEERFVDNPCRGIVLGMNEEGELIQLAWIMGRSPNSQNRVYVVDEKNGILRTEAADPSKVEDPRLIIYNAMRMIGKRYIVSNGDQTDTIYSSISDNLMKGVDSISPYDLYKAAVFDEVGVDIPTIVFNALTKRYCEPDAPIFTPRISGYQYDGKQNKVYLSILKASPYAKEKWLETIEKNNLKKEGFRGEGMSEKEVNETFNYTINKMSELDYKKFPTLRYFCELVVPDGFGYCLTTYKPGSKTLDSFEGEPFVVPLKGELEEIMQTFWKKLEPEWKVALGGKSITGKSYYMAEPINRFERVR